MKRSLVALIGTLALSISAASAAYAATCTSKWTTEDGIEMEVTVEGDRCVTNLDTLVCTCS